MQIGKSRRGSPVASAMRRRTASRCEAATWRATSWAGSASPTISICSLTGREPSDEQRFFLDLLLVAIAEHGLVPTVQAARMTLAADPGSLQGAVAAGLLGAGPVILGTSELCAAGSCWMH